MAHARKAAVAVALLAACAGPAGSRRDGIELSGYDLQARLGARAASLVGHASDFEVDGARFNADCTGFVEAVYQAEGVPLRALMRETAPEAHSGVAAAYRTVRAYGVLFGGGGEWPAPGDLVFWHDTYDRDRNGATDDRLTHVGIVEYVEPGGTVVFVHRGGKAVARGAMTIGRPAERAEAGVELNTPLRHKQRRAEGVPVLAGALFSAYGRIDPARIPARAAP